MTSKEVRDFAWFCKFMNDLFDSLDAHLEPEKTPPASKYKSYITPKSCHHEFWKKAKQNLKNMAFIKNSEDVKFEELKTKEDFTNVSTPSIKNFIRTIEGYEELFKKLINEYGFEYMVGKRLNQDRVENYFGRVRNANAQNTSMTCYQFEGIKKKKL